MAWKPNAISYVHKSEESFFFLSLSLNMLVYTNSLVPVLLVFISSVQRYPRVLQRHGHHASVQPGTRAFADPSDPFFSYFRTAEKNNFISFLLKTRY